MNKYHAKKTEAFGFVFDSAKEARRYGDLVLLQRAGEIGSWSVKYRSSFGTTASRFVGTWPTLFITRRSAKSLRIAKDFGLTPTKLNAT